ncbi:MAG: 1-deoxy-D-xylulose-5-phosphate reductoisomerase [Clostridiales bacterium]|nr:1-deoxy-D-xylulose-5-phosphate reductoisomerase [Clostridiales bacterium]
MISILGSSGSIGTQTIEVAQKLNIGVAALAVGRSIELAEKQARMLHPKLVAVYDEAAAKNLKTALADTDIRVGGGMSAVLEAASLPEAETVVAAMSGSVGLMPAMTALEAGKRLAFANKETLVCAGEIVMKKAAETGAEILPVDSEHSAIFQCLQGGGDVKRLIITASGGPFRGKKRPELENVTRADALKHPNWSMGAKITVDSATLMNKGLEFIEAMHLFAVSPDHISVLVHPQSIVHSMVEFADGSVIAQMGAPDMKLPIQLALTWPRRVPGAATPLDLRLTKPLTFEEPDMETFRALPLAMELARHRGTADCCVMNAANEVAAWAFLEGRIGFLEIYDVVEKVCGRLAGMAAADLSDVAAADEAARRYASECISSLRS